MTAVVFFIRMSSTTMNTSICFPFPFGVSPPPGVQLRTQPNSQTPVRAFFERLFLVQIAFKTPGCQNLNL